MIFFNWEFVILLFPCFLVKVKGTIVNENSPSFVEQVGDEIYAKKRTKLNTTWSVIFMQQKIVPYSR